MVVCVRERGREQLWLKPCCDRHIQSLTSFMGAWYSTGSQTRGQWPPGWHIYSADCWLWLTPRVKNFHNYIFSDAHIFFLPALFAWFTHAIHTASSLSFVYLKIHVHILFTKCTLSSCQGSTSNNSILKKRCLEYDTKLLLMVRLQFWRPGEYEVHLHCHYSQIQSDLEW